MRLLEEMLREFLTPVKMGSRNRILFQWMRNYCISHWLGIYWKRMVASVIQT